MRCSAALAARAIFRIACDDGFVCQNLLKEDARRRLAIWVSWLRRRGGRVAGDQREFMRLHRPQSLIQRLIEPEEIANMVVYLASPLASATTGGALRVDGGYVDAILP